MSWTDGFSNTALDGLDSSVTLGHIDIQLQSIVLARADVLIQDFTITTDETVSYVKLGRTVDADQDEWLSGTRATVNDAGLGYASSMGAYDERTLAIGGAVLGGDLGQGGVCTWCDSVSDMEGTDTTSSSGDQQAFVVVDGGTLHEDEAVTIRFIYAFAVGEEAAQDLALEMLSLDDLDGDGLSLDEGDCDDLDPDTYDGATEIIDGRDNDCDDPSTRTRSRPMTTATASAKQMATATMRTTAFFPGAEPVDGVTNADCDGVADAPESESEDPDEVEDTGAPEDDTGAIEDTGGVEDELDTGDTEEDSESAEEDPPAGDDDDDATPSGSAADGVVGTDEKHSSCSQAPAAPPCGC